MSTQTSTIFAPASAQGRAGVAVFRISGPEAREAILRLCKPGKIPNPREATLTKIYNPAGELIDHALILWFPGPNSFTGEDVVEFHMHGGRAISNAVAAALGSLPHFRLAEPGEFTRRAFENDKMDLTEAEAVADLIHAETESQRRQALRQFEGELGKLYENWRARLTRALAYLEATIDFSDEDLPKNTGEKEVEDISALAKAIAQHLDDRHRGERLREGFQIAILGPPNAGKSSLLNALAKRDAAIVSSIAGTTRDVIEVHLDLGGYAVIVADTAGLRDSADVIETEGVKRAMRRAEQADLKLLVFDGEKYPQLDEATKKLADDDALLVLNKCDLIRDGGRGIGDEKSALPVPRPSSLIPISVKSGQGLQQLLDALLHQIDLRFADTGAPTLTRARHREALQDCHQHLERALAAPATELRAEDLRLAARALGRITGRVDVEDLLDIIFRDFCIGK